MLCTTVRDVYHGVCVVYHGVCVLCTTVCVLCTVVCVLCTTVSDVYHGVCVVYHGMCVMYHGMCVVYHGICNVETHGILTVLSTQHTVIPDLFPIRCKREYLCSNRLNFAIGLTARHRRIIIKLQDNK